MTDQTSAALLRAAAQTVRRWTTDPAVESWASAVGARFGPELAQWLDNAAEDAEHIGADPGALALARKILGAETTGRA